MGGDFSKIVHGASPVVYRSVDSQRYWIVNLYLLIDRNRWRCGSTSHGAEVRPVSADPQGFQIADPARRRDQDGSILTPESFDSYGAGPVRLELSGIYPVDRAEEILLPDIYAIVAQDRVGSH